MCPEYESDAVYSRENPFEWANQYIIPGIICPICGPWSGSRRLFLSLTDPILINRLSKTPFPIPLDEWNKLTNSIAKNIGTALDLRLQPGDELGRPTGIITNITIPDIIFPWEGSILISEKTRQILAASELTGYQTKVIEIVEKCRGQFHHCSLPTLYVLIVTGRISPSPEAKYCPICNRFVANYSVDPGEMNWDGNDFLIDRNYPELVFVTERVCKVFRENNFKNYQCKSIYPLQG
jgi:hypothetical protein